MDLAGEQGVDTRMTNTWGVRREELEESSSSVTLFKTGRVKIEEGGASGVSGNTAP